MMEAIGVRNVIKRVFNTGLRNFDAKGDNMITFRALHFLRPCSYSTSHRRYFRVSMPTTAEVMMNTPGVSCAYGFGYDDQFGYKHDMGGRPGYAVDSRRRLFLSGAYPFRVSGNIRRYSSSVGKIQSYSLDAGNIHSLGLDYIVDNAVITARYHLHMNPGGKRLLQVFSIRIIECENSVYLYGTIELKAVNNGSVYLYERQSSDPELVSRDGTLSLTGSSCCLNADQGLCMPLKLKDKNGNPFPVEDDKVLHFGFDCYDFVDYHWKCDMQLKYYYYGNSASIVVYYTVFDNAVQAKVDVDVVNVDGADHVYGRIVARYSNYDYSTDERRKYFQTVLFDKAANNYVEVEPEKAIPLSRYVVAVPNTSLLIIEANLWNYVKLEKTDDQIAKGTLVFQPEGKGETTKGILRHNGLGEVRVTVTWGDECESL